jgi:non-specific serine/threonine protein kinase
MLVVHALWRNGRLTYWAEDSAAPVEPDGDLHPFAVAGPETVTLLLPTIGGRPADSPELIRAEEPPRGKPSLRPWRVPILADAPAGDAEIGASLRHFDQVRDFAADLVRRGRVLPWVDATDAGPRAVWRPVLTGGDAHWAQALAQAQPAIARAETGESSVAEALDAMVDATAREMLARQGIDDQAWLRGLTAPVAEVQRELAAWQRDAAGAAIRACFRLVEPSETEESWRVEFALQPADEPSLVIPAHRVWKSRKLPARLKAPKETLLAELGRAHRLWPRLEDALDDAEPFELRLDAEGAHRFLREAAPLLHTAGFGVLLPKWWGRPSSRLGARLKATSKTAPGTVAGRSALGLESLVDYSWELSLGGEPLTEKELTELAELKAPLVKLRGQWVELDTRRLANGLKLLREGGQFTVADLLHAGLSTQDGPLGVPVLSVTADGPLGDLLGGKPPRLAQPPDEFVGELRPYQRRGLSWLAFLQSLGLGGILADDMGLGKTVQLLALLAAPDSGRTLLVCPMSLVGNWQREAARFAPKLSVHVHHGADRRLDPDADLVITTYALAARDFELLREAQWDRIVVDEAQAIKNAATRQAVAIRALPARHRIAVTGTPVENRLADLWSLMEFANPGLLGPAATFKRAYAVPIERHADADAAERLRRMTAPFILRRVKTDKSIISDLPDKLEMEVLCNLTAEQATLYQAIVDDMMRRIESSSGMERRGLVLATMTKLKQVCNHPAQFLADGSRLSGRSGKLARLDEILEEVLAAQEKALLFTQYASFGAMLRGHLSARFGREVLFLHGGVGKPERDALVRRFQSAEPGSPALFILSLKAGGTGLTLTEANHVIHVDRWWNPAVEDQATDRAFRIGQKRNVQVRKFVCAGTVEEKISAMITEKRGLAARIVGTGELPLSELSTSELRELFALTPDAVSE